MSNLKANILLSLQTQVGIGCRSFSAYILIMSLLDVHLCLDFTFVDIAKICQ